MKKINASLFALLFLATPFFAQNKEKKRDSHTTEKREVGTFDALDIELAADIFIRQGDSAQVEVEGPDDVLERIKTEVKDGKLYVTTQSNWKNWNQFEKIRLYLTVPTLNEVVFSGVGKMEMKGKWVGQKLKLKLEGAHNVYMPDLKLEEFIAIFDGTGSLEVGGNADKVKLTLNGTGSIFANDLVAQNAKCSVNGVGKLECQVSDELVADVSGLGSILYGGEPKNVRSSVSGLGRVRALRGH
jgi:hypothetical protein